MRKIICYGDSNTFGFNPKDASRYNEQTRWTGILQTKFKNDYKIIEEGACDRTGFVYNGKGYFYSAQLHFPEILNQINNEDILILAIGTNDLQFTYDIDFYTVEKGLENLIKAVQVKTKNIIIIPPVVLEENILDGYFKIQFDEKSILKSKNIGKIYKKISDKYKCQIFDINEYTQPSETDGLHYDESSHKIIAEKLYEFIKKLYG